MLVYIHHVGVPPPAGYPEQGVYPGQQGMRGAARGQGMRPPFPQARDDDAYFGRMPRTHASANPRPAPRPQGGFAGPRGAMVDPFFQGQEFNLPNWDLMQRNNGRRRERVSNAIDVF